MSLVKDIPRTVGRELTKLVWYLPRAIGFLLLFFFLPIIGQVLWFLFNAWMIAIQYCDYPYDNHKVDFTRMRLHLGEHKGKAMTFGMMVNIFSLIPVVNFIVMPVAICGATSMWVRELKDTLAKQWRVHCFSNDNCGYLPPVNASYSANQCAASFWLPLLWNAWKKFIEIGRWAFCFSSCCCHSTKYKGGITPLS